MAKLKGYSILSIEAKDLVATGNYSIRNADGEIRLRKFENTLDWSLDSIKLKKEYEATFRRKDFYFIANGKKYTQAVVNVTFSYSYKEFNSAGKNTFIRAGYSYRDCVFQDGAYTVDNVLIAIQTNIEVKNPLPQSVLGKNFTFVDGYYRQTRPFRVLMSKAELREELYKNGFVCDGIKYVRYKRSAGSSRVGKCLFVMDALSKRMARWDRCGLTIRNGSPILLSEYEAYISLPMSSIIDTISINPENILLIQDYKSVFEDEVVAVEEKDNALVSERKVVKIENTIWDGESLMDCSLFGKYKDKGMLLLRNRFFKTCAFNTNIQKWFIDNGITEVSQLNGFTRAKDISDIKLITTPSSVKYLKFGTFEEWLDNIDNIFGVVKYEKETHFFNGRMVQCHYQLLNTLHLSYEDIQTLLNPSLNYIGAIRTDPAVLRYHVCYSFKNSENNDALSFYKDKSDIVFKLLGINDAFANTKIYKDFKDSIVKGFYRNLRRGHVLINGNYQTLLGNGIELLQSAIGKFNGESILEPLSIHTKRFPFGVTLLGSRSPHVTMGNVLLAKNEESELIDRYFNLTKEIVYINSIDNNILNRLSGADMDSDTMLITDNELLIATAKRNYSNYKVPTNCVESKKTARHYTPEDKADLDIKTSVNKIGEIVNLSQQLNSLYWDRINNGESIEDNEELYNDICKLDVLSGIEIDKAKKEFSIDSEKELNVLRTKYRITNDDGKAIRPMFFKMITTENGFELSPNVEYKYYKTSMDYLQKAITSARYKQARAGCKTIIPFTDIIKKPCIDSRSGYYNQKKEEIISEIRECKSVISALFMDYSQKTDSSEKEQIKELVQQEKRKYSEIIHNISAHDYLMYIVLKELDKKENQSIRTIMFELLFSQPNETFIGMIRKSKEPIDYIEECENGTETYYCFNFKRVKG